MPSRPPAWSYLPAVVGVIGTLLIALSFAVPWFVGDFDHRNFGPVGTVGVTLLGAVAGVILMFLRSGWALVAGVWVFACGSYLLASLHPRVICPTDIDYDGNIADLCFEEEWAAGSFVFAAGALLVVLATINVVWVRRVAERSVQVD